MKITKKPILNILNEHLNGITWKIMLVEKKILSHKKNMAYLIIGLVGLVFLHCLVTENYFTEWVIEVYHLGIITYLFFIVKEPITTKCPENFNEDRLGKKLRNLVIFVWVYTFLLSVPLLWITKFFIVSTGVNPLHTLAQAGFKKSFLIFFIANRPVVIKHHTTEYVQWMYYSLLTTNTTLAITITAGYTLWLKIIKSDPVSKTKLLMAGAKWVSKTLLKKKVGPKVFGICSACVVATTAFIGVHDSIHDQSFYDKLRNKADLENTLGRELYSLPLLSKEKAILIPPYQKGSITYPKYTGSFFSDQTEYSMFKALSGTPEKSYGYQLINASELTREHFEVKIESELARKNLQDIDRQLIPKPNITISNVNRLDEINHTYLTKTVPSFCTTYKKYKSAVELNPELGKKPVRFEIDSNDLVVTKYCGTENNVKNLKKKY